MRRWMNGMGWGRLYSAVVVWASLSGGVVAEAQSVQTPQAPAAATRPSVTLSTDSDPVPSPDPDNVPQSSDGTPGGVGQVVEDHGRFTLQTGAYEVRLNASVIDSSGQTVDSLPQSAFHVYEDGVLQTIAGFRHEDLPVSLGILIDSSGSMYDKRQAVDVASLDLVRLSNPLDEAFLVDFGSEAYIDQDFTSDISKLERGLSEVKSAGGTALYDAVIASADYLMKSAKHPKQVLLIVTDGDDNASSATLEQAIQRVQDMDGPAIYCIGLLFGEDVSHADARHSRQVLSELAAQTGGAAYFPHSLKDVDGITRDVAADIRSQYTISYRSTNPPQNGGYRQVHVEAKEKGYRGLQVRTRSGYFPKVRGNTAAAAPSR
ncbi:MAG: VWA domain-containing protein [Acidobacteriaceae bacterium]|nr:VWA domain-containing protein [Acidobacteriaceae bacterium]